MMPTTMAFSGEKRVFGLTFSELFSFTMIVAACNALLPTVVGGIAGDGVWYSLLNTFEVSAIVWAGLFLGIRYVREIPEKPIGKADLAAALTTLACCVLPLGPFTWVVLSSAALYLIVTAGGPLSSQAHGGWILLAVTVPMFWSKRLFNFFAEFLLSLDAMLVSRITQTPRVANLVAMPGGAGYLQIAAPCSSMANVSLAILCWVLFTQVSNTRWRPRNVVWCAVSCAAVVAINTTRIALIGFFPQRYELLHGPVGATVVSWITVAAVVSICFVGVSRGPRQAI